MAEPDRAILPTAADAGSGPTGAPLDPPPPAGAFPEPGAPEVLVRLRAEALRLLRWPWTYVLLAALGPLLWGRPYGDFLYGQDSSRLLQPFAFNDSPMIPYSYLLSSTFPVPDYTPYFYVDVTLRALASAGAPAWVAERLVIGLFAGLAAAGVVVLLRALEPTREQTATTSGIVVGIVVLAYVYNPFTLSVTFWHFEGWTLFLAFLPWLAALVVRVVYDRVLPLRLAAVVTLLGVYLAPGAISSFAVPVALVVVWGLLATFLRRSSDAPSWRGRFGRAALLLAVGLGVEGWSFVPFLLVPNLAYTSNNYVTPQNLAAIYASSSATWGAFPVLTLTAFSWLTRAPSAYGWIALLPVIAAAAVVFPLSILVGARRLSLGRRSMLVYAAGLTVLPFMIGGIAPITVLNLALLHVGGPFLVLAGGYYFLGTVYVLLAAVGVYEALLWIRTPPTDRAPAPGSFVRTGWHRVDREIRRRPAAATAVVVVLLVVSALPFGLGEVYQTTGPNADALPVPPSYETLGGFFGTPPAGPDYYVLAIPMSAQDGVFVNVSGSHLLDTGDLLSSYIPYPVLAMNNGPTAEAVEDLFANGPPANLTAVLADLHVRYVVDDPFADAGAPSMNRAPDGLPIDYAALRADLRSSLGPPTPVGPFGVYEVPAAVPLGWTASSLVGIDVANATDALGFVGSVQSGPPGWAGALRAAMWSAGGTLPGWEVRPTPVEYPSVADSIPSGFTAGVVGRNGSWTPPPCATGRCASGGTTFSWSGPTLTVAGPVERSTDRPGDYTTDVAPSAAGYCAPPGGQGDLAANGTVSGPAVLAATLTLAPPTSDSWATFALSAGALSLVFQAYANASTQSAYIGLAAEENGLPFAWHNAEVPGGIAFGEPVHVTIGWNATTATASLGANGTTTDTILGFGDAAADAANPGLNRSVVPAGQVSLESANESIQLAGGAFCLQSTDVAQLPDVAFVVASGPGAPSTPPALGASSVTTSGDFVLHPGTDQYVVLGYPEDGLWVGSVSGGGRISDVSGAPLSNVFALTGAGNGTAVTLHFRTWILVGLDLSWVEVAGLVTLLAVLAIRARRRPRPSEASRPSTPDGPAPGPRTDPPP
ncbi:MAG TPA: hypothetical protein VGP88_00655 [Thermoplasmata archaeon]|jgi:hypothetical protein|nr:hypothetical protein [Thermoplasmata archaeon]